MLFISKNRYPVVWWKLNSLLSKMANRKKYRMEFRMDLGAAEIPLAYLSDSLSDIRTKCRLLILLSTTWTCEFQLYDNVTDEFLMKL